MKDLTQTEMNNLVINISATSQLLHELLDDLEETSYYRQTLKSATNRLQAELGKVCDSQTNDLWAADNKSMMAIQRGIAQMINQVRKADPLRIAAMGDLLKKDEDALIKETI